MEVKFRTDHQSVADDVLLAMPGVTSGKMFGHPAYKVGKKAFAFIGGEGIGIKLPANRVQELVDADGEVFTPFGPVEGMVWKEWVMVTHDNSEEYRQYGDLFQESLEFVAG